MELRFNVLRHTMKVVKDYYKQKVQWDFLEIFEILKFWNLFEKREQIGLLGYSVVFKPRTAAVICEAFRKSICLSWHHLRCAQCIRFLCCSFLNCIPVLCVQISWVERQVEGRLSTHVWLTSAKNSSLTWSPFLVQSRFSSFWLIFANQPCFLEFMIRGFTIQTDWVRSDERLCFSKKIK